MRGGYSASFGFRNSDFFRPSDFGLRIWLVCCVLAIFPLSGRGTPADSLFITGVEAYHTGDYKQAATVFRQAAAFHPGSGTLQNLGNAEWQQGRTGEAVLAWQQALWLDPFNESARSNLRFARKTAQLESPEFSWFEVVSTWLPVNWWAWTASASLWLAIGMGILPGILRWRKLAWHQAVAALGLAIFLLSVPAQFGLSTRSKLGFILRKDVPLRLTPTRDAQYVTRLAAGEPARLERYRGQYYLIRTSHTLGWVEKDQFRLICEPPEAGVRNSQAAGL
jgi:tetratricopeptide (TPR) repeat protein